MYINLRHYIRLTNTPLALFPFFFIFLFGKSIVSRLIYYISLSTEDGIFPAKSISTQMVYSFGWIYKYSSIPSTLHSDRFDEQELTLKMKFSIEIFYFERNERQIVNPKNFGCEFNMIQLFQSHWLMTCIYSSKRFDQKTSINNYKQDSDYQCDSYQINFELFWYILKLIHSIGIVSRAGTYVLFSFRSFVPFNLS